VFLHKGDPGPSGRDGLDGAAGISVSIEKVVEARQIK